MLDLIGPLGHGFDTSGDILLVGGGIGVPPLLYAARKATGSVTAVLGFRTSGCVLLQEAFEKACSDVYLTTDDGTAGGTRLRHRCSIKAAGRKTVIPRCWPAARSRCSRP